MSAGSVLHKLIVLCAVIKWWQEIITDPLNDSDASPWPPPLFTCLFVFFPSSFSDAFKGGLGNLVIGAFFVAKRDTFVLK